MAKLKNINGHFVESDYENALIAFLEREGWQYLFGDSITRANRKEVLYMDDLLQFLKDNNKNVKDEELLTSTMRHPFHIRVYARPDFQVFNLGLGYSEYRKAA